MANTPSARSRPAALRVPLPPPFAQGHGAAGAPRPLAAHARRAHSARRAAGCLRGRVHGVRGRGRCAAAGAARRGPRAVASGVIWADTDLHVHSRSSTIRQSRARMLSHAASHTRQRLSESRFTASDHAVLSQRMQCVIQATCIRESRHGLQQPRHSASHDAQGALHPQRQQSAAALLSHRPLQQLAQRHARHCLWRVLPPPQRPPSPLRCRRRCSPAPWPSPPPALPAPWAGC
jgi:hypothetical protein